MKHETDEKGCFYFGGVLAAPKFSVEVTKPGFKNYKEIKEFDYYDIDIILSPENSDQENSGSWQKLGSNQLAAYKGCADE